MKFLSKLLLPTLILLFANCYSQVSTLKDTEAAKVVSKDVVQLFKENKINDSFKILKKYWPIPENEIDNLESQTIQSMNLISQRYGNAEGIVKSGEQNIKDTGFRETYLIKFENTAIRFVFTYYKNNKGWILNAFKWDSDFDEEFK